MSWRRSRLTGSETANDGDEAAVPLSGTSLGIANLPQISRLAAVPTLQVQPTLPQVQSWSHR